ncbi:MAG: methylated-DNA--[protein]-cysteine S-methyltransferase [Psychrobium sp.]|nr:methylated-DNA--[protein]-cysteine S-methyltransferase [Psychrobium sp.]
MPSIDIQFFKTPYADLIIGSYQNKLCLLDYRYRKMRDSLDQKLQQRLNATFVLQDNALLRRTRLQIEQYLMSQRQTFDLPLLMVANDFDKKVWQALIQVPYGTTSTYSNLAAQLNCDNIPKIASANSNNTLALIVPCHRILSDRGELIAYGGGLGLKLKLINLEQSLF